VNAKELTDYSGQFRPELKPGDFSHTTVTKLLDVYSKILVRVDGFWYLAVKELVSNKVALDCDLKVWQRVCRYEMENITEQLNIRGRNVAALMKAMRMVPWLQQVEHKIDCDGQNSATLTVTKCLTLSSLEREGEGREAEMCNEVEAKIFKYYAEFFSPDIRVECLKSPPRQSRDGICCRWRFFQS